MADEGDGTFMSAQFWPCPACSRHVKRGDAICPFCGETASVDIGPRRVLAGRLSRAALFAAGTAGIAVTTTNCNSAPMPPTVTITPPYGLGPVQIETEDSSTSDGPAETTPDAGDASAVPTDSSTPSQDATSAADVSTDAADASPTDSAIADEVILTVTHYGGLAPPDE
jgi:hypothetical protein